MGKIKKLLVDYKETVTVAIGEVIVSAVMFGIYLLIGAFDMTVVYGAILGSAVTVLNIFALSFLINRALARYLRLRGEGEMSEEEAAAFAAEHARSVQLAAKGSYIVRTLMMLGSLVLAFLLSDLFDVIATLVPLIAYRPIIFVFEIIKMKLAARKLKGVDLGALEGIEVDDFTDISGARSGSVEDPSGTSGGSSDESEVE